MGSRKEILNNDVETVFRRDVVKAKENYRKKRSRIIISILVIIFLITMVTNITNIMKKRNLSNEITEQSEMIEKLDKEHQVNEVLTEKLKDPVFITDLVRQEYGMSYSGELIFNLPLQEKFMDSAIKSIMNSDLNNRETTDSSKLIDDTKIPKIENEDKDKKKSKTSTNQKNSSSTEGTTVANNQSSSTKTVKNSSTTSNKASVNNQNEGN